MAGITARKFQSVGAAGRLVGISAGLLGAGEREGSEGVVCLVVSICFTLAASLLGMFFSSNIPQSCFELGGAETERSNGGANGVCEGGAVGVTGVVLSTGWPFITFLVGAVLSLIRANFRLRDVAFDAKGSAGAVAGIAEDGANGAEGGAGGQAGVTIASSCLDGIGSADDSSGAEEGNT